MLLLYRKKLKRKGRDIFGGSILPSINASYGPECTLLKFCI